MEFTTTDPSELEFKRKFEEKLHDYDNNHQGSFRKPWSNERITEVIANVKNARISMVNTDCRTSMSYYWLSKYDTLTINNEDHLIFKRKNPEDPVIRIIPREEYFHILNTVHNKCGHGGRDKMVSSFKKRFYIPKKAIEIFVSLCSTCNTKRSTPKKSTVTQPGVSKDFNVKGHIDLIDLQSSPDGDYKWLLKYQDNTTKFLTLRPLKTNTPTEVATRLLEIFLTFGAPCILQSGNGVEFTAEVIEKLLEIWPDCKTLQDSTKSKRRSEFVGSNQEVENMIRLWMMEKKSTNWSVGCFFCQYQINSSLNEIIGRSPYKALFGSEPKVSLGKMNIDPQLFLKIETEEQQNNDINEQFDDGYYVPIAEALHEQPESSENYEIPNADTQELLAKSDNEIEYNDEPNEIDSFPVNLIRVRVPNHKNVNNTPASPSFELDLTCVMCQKPINGAHSSPSKDGSKVLCFKCKTGKNKMFHRKKARKSMKRASEQNIEITSEKLPPLSVGKCVLVNISQLHRGPLDTKNIKGKIVDFRNGVYKIATKTGTIKNWFERHELHPLLEDYDDDISETPISLKEVVNYELIYSIDGFLKCICKTTKNPCRSMRCSCFKKKVLCSFQCHDTTSCFNK